MNSRPEEAAANCGCACGQVRYIARGEPMFRMRCHCTLCQRFNDAPFADVLIYRARQIDPPPEDRVEFTALRPPPNVQRGRCRACGQAAIEQFKMPILSDLTMVPVAVHPSPDALPEPVGHMFYDCRQADIDDDLPRYRGYLSSQWAFIRHWLKT